MQTDLPEMMDNESLEDWSKRIEDYIKNNKFYGINNNIYERDYITATKKEHIQKAIEEQAKCDAVMNALCNIGVNVKIRLFGVSNDELVDIPKRKENESILDWSARIDNFKYKMEENLK